MSTETTESDGSDKERLAELAHSNRETAPVYAALYKYRYGEEP